MLKTQIHYPSAGFDSVSYVFRVCLEVATQITVTVHAQTMTLFTYMHIAAHWTTNTNGPHQANPQDQCCTGNM